RFMNCRVPASKRYQPTEYEHAANCATHGLWILPSLVGGSVLYFLSVDQWQRTAAWLYGGGLTGLFVTSTLFHTAAWKISHLRKVEQRFHMCDRMAIYFFIAASYSPWLMLRELGPWSCHMRWLIWVMAGVGSMYVFFFHERLEASLLVLETSFTCSRVLLELCRYKLLELLGYVAMGALPALVVLSMVERAGVCELGLGRRPVCGGRRFLQERRSGPFRPRHLAPFRGGGSECSLLRHLEVPVPAGVHAAHVKVTSGPASGVAFRVTQPW
ncbi:unnamed protein product, partial [Tetraodon nigroviridis]